MTEDLELLYTNKTEELLYLALLTQMDRERIFYQYELSLARSLVADKYPQLSQQEIQDSFEELALSIRHNLTLPDYNRFKYVAIQYLKER